MSENVSSLREKVVSSRLEKGLMLSHASSLQHGAAKQTSTAGEPHARAAPVHTRQKSACPTLLRAFPNL